MELEVALATAIVASIIFTMMGVILFALTFLIVDKLSPFSLRKVIEEDQNIAIGVVLASVIIGTAIIVSAAVHG